MKLIIGLGNPGKQYENTRHNAGYMCIDALAKEYGVEFDLDLKFKGMIALVNDMGKKAILLKPVTFMNLSGQSVQLVMSYFKIDIEDIIVLSDDLDSPLGRVRIRANGMAGGHNGHRNIIDMIGSSNYKRIKVGIDRSSVIPVVDYVLQKFSEGDLAIINNSVEVVCKACKAFIDGTSFEKIASTYCSSRPVEA